MEKEWFASWFDSPYYHLLYKDRDDIEAGQFIENLVNHLSLSTNASVLDLACGTGRHSKTLKQFDYNVLGIDLSPNSIEKATKHSEPGLCFKVHDMRNVIPNHSFDAVFNLFTSFGYFEENYDNIKVLSSIHKMLKDNGLLVIDFMNVSKVVSELVKFEVKIVDDIEFTITREFNGKHIIKSIEFTVDGVTQNHIEKVQAFSLSDFQKILKDCQFEITDTFGDFKLNSFDENTSDRLILIAEKI